MEHSQNIEMGLAKVTDRGLILNGCVYTHPLMMRYGWFELAKIQGEWTIPVLYNVADLRKVVLFDAHSSKLFVATTDEHEQVSKDSLEEYFTALNELKGRTDSIQGPL